MAQIALDLTTVKASNDWSDGKNLTGTKLDNILIASTTSINAFCDRTYSNLEQLRKDIDASYDFDNDGNKQFSTWGVFNKQYSLSQISSNPSLGTSTDVSFADVSGFSATFTPDTFTGYFKVTMIFTDHSISSSNADIDCETSYQISDGSTTSGVVKVQHRIDGTGLAGGDITELCVPVTIVHVFNWSSSLQTVKLQKKVTTATGVATHDMDQSASNVGIILIEKI